MKFCSLAARPNLSILSLAALSLLVVAPPAAFAQNIEFLHRGPIAYMNDVDKQILSQTLNTALDDVADGETLGWSNPETGSEGIIEVLDTHEDYGTTCRTVRTHSRASGRDGGGIYRLCLADDDTWQFAPRRRQESD